MLSIKKENGKYYFYDYRKTITKEFDSERELRLYLASREMYEGKLKAIRYMLLEPIEAIGTFKVKKTSEYALFINQLDRSYNEEEYNKIIDSKYYELVGTDLLSKYEKEELLNYARTKLGEEIDMELEKIKDPEIDVKFLTKEPKEDILAQIDKNVEEYEHLVKTAEKNQKSD